MSNTNIQDAQDVLEWISKNNGFWNSDLLELKQSKFGGVGVFAKEDIDPGLLPNTVLLRLHKGSILSAKTSSIANLITEDGIDGALALIIAFIYEQEAGKSSPWYSFIKSIKYKDGEGKLILPPSLWTKEEKVLLKGAELELMGALDESENQIQFERACEFALGHYESSNEQIQIPWTFDIREVNDSDLLSKFETFIAISHAVASRDFEIDEYHEVALVPGACLFNHSNKPTVRFESLFSVCVACGETNCNHELDESEEESEEEDEEGDEEDDDDEMQGDSDEDIDNSQDHGHHNGNTHSHSHSHNHDHAHSHSEYQDEHEESGSEDEDEDEFFDGPIEEFIEIIEEAYQLEQQETQAEREALAKLKNGDFVDEEDSEGDEQGPIIFEDGDKLISPDDCCDIVLTKKVQKGEELFNTYGDFSNSILLPKYGFVIPSNANDTIGLGPQLLKLKKQNKKLYSRQFEWWEKEGYRSMKDLLFSKKNEHEDESSCKDSCCGDDHDHDHDEEEDEDDHETHWTMEVELQNSGEASPLTYALLKLLSLNRVEITKFLKTPEKVNLQLLTTKSSKALKILQEVVEKRQKEYNNINYKKLLKSTNEREKLAAQLVIDEQEIIKKALKYITKKV